jgi:hypothetical protein
MLLIALLAAAALIWLPGLRRPATSEKGLSFASDIDNWRQTDLARTLRTPYDFTLGPNLSRLPLHLGNWRGEDVPQTNLEVFILLEPEQYIQRRYQDAGEHIVWLSVIGSHKSKSFHPPQICYSADGWVTQVSTARLALKEGEVHALRVDATIDQERHLVLYFYLWPDAGRDPAAGTVLFKLTVPIFGATTDEAQALEVAQDFVGQVFTRGTNE